LARLSVSRFSISIFGLTLAAHVPFALALLVPFGGSPAGLVGASALSTLFVWGLRGRVRLAFDDEPITAMRRWLVEIPYYVHWCAVVAALPLFVLASPLALFTSCSLGQLALTAYLLALVFALWGVVARPRMLRLRVRELRLAELPSAFDGYRVLHVSDVHLGSLFPPERLAAWLRRAAALSPDLVALTGDYVTSGTRFHEAAAETLASAPGRDGIVAVAGNHDDYGGGEPLRSSLRARGIELLENAHRVYARGDQRLIVVGVDDVYSRRVDVERAFSGVPARSFVLALAHEPGLFPQIAARGATLVLSGHTHWGQLGVPWLAERLNLGRVFYRHASGLAEHGDSALHVSPGLGTTFVPARLGVAPEMTLLVLRRGAP
jgi:predicted MPP superfamily phosphohydrolase